MRVLSAAVAPLLLLFASTAAARERLEVTLGTLEWPPYVGASLMSQGYAAEVVRTACARRGVDVKYEFMPWSRALMLGLRGDVAGVMPEYRNAQREAEFAFSIGFAGGAVGLYKRRSDAIAYGVDPLADLDGALRSVAQYRIGIVRDYINNATFDRADYLQREEAASDDVNLRKLAHRRVDLVFIDRWVADYLMRRDPLLRGADLEMMPPPIEEPALHVAWSRHSDAAELARPACDAGIAELRLDGTVDTLRRKHGLVD